MRSPLSINNNVLARFFIRCDVTGFRFCILLRRVVAPPVVMAALLLLLNACSTVVQRNPVPEQLVDQAVVAGFPDVRFWGDEHPENAMEIMRRALDRQRAAGLLLDASGNPRPMTFLALSGGGSEGAFGAGLLNGWSAAEPDPSSPLSRA
jgi:hypothetical protein